MNLRFYFNSWQSHLLMLNSMAHAFPGNAALTTNASTVEVNRIKCSSLEPNAQT